MRSLCQSSILWISHTFYIVTMICIVSILDRPKSHHPMDPVLVGSYCTYQYKHKISKACVQQKITTINNIQIFYIIDKNM